MRMFVAGRPPERVREHLEEFLAPRRAAAPFRWSRPEQIHLTLAFMPDVADHDLDALVDALGSAAARRVRFEAVIAGGGAFPDVARGRVLFADLAVDEAGRTELDRLAVGARNAAVNTGTVVDGQRFRPHFTLARCGRPTELSRWVRLLDAYRGPVWPVEDVQLLASHLGEGPRRRPRYEQIAELRLGGVG